MLNRFLHGCDYNPDQWLDEPAVLEKDIKLMKQANINCVSLGIFAWAALEPQEGNYTFDWLEKCINRLYENGIYTILATPSGARPAWLAKKYPEVLRVSSSSHRNHMGERHNHCYTSPAYREKVWKINKKLAEAFGNHPGVILWHLSNEYGGECYCERCVEAFREWLKKKYKTLEMLNKQWWTAFWSHTYFDWNEIEPPLTNGENSNFGLILDWKRFVTNQTVDFCTWEKQAVRAGGSNLPVTSNFMGFYEGLNYAKFGDVLDVYSWDSYPTWHTTEKSSVRLAAEIACAHDMTRCLHPEKAPFLLMESTPSMVNWNKVSKLKRPGMHMLSSMQAIAHGSDSVQYFQWRKGRGGFEKFHGAVVDHYGEADTRVFSDVKDLGERLQGLSEVSSSCIKPQVAIVFDQENRWALEFQGGPRNTGMHYLETVFDHYQAFWEMGIPVDVIDSSAKLEDYSLVIAPMLYLYQNGIEEKMKSFVAGGGTLVGTYHSGIVNENDLCHIGKVPHSMIEVFGLWREEIDALYDGEYNSMSWNEKEYTLYELCERIHLTTAKELSQYGADFYKGETVLCHNNYEDGQAFYLAARADEAFYKDFYKMLAKDIGLGSAIDAQLPNGVTAGVRKKDDEEFIIVQNFNSTPVEIKLNMSYKNTETNEILQDKIDLQGYEVMLLKDV